MSIESTNCTHQSARIGLFVTCLVDLFRPSIGFATIKLLKQTNCLVFVPENQTCCGQPAYNNGDEETARIIAKQVIQQFSNFDYVVAPSGSCLAMIKIHYPKLLNDEPEWYLKAQDLAERSYEILCFLNDISTNKTDIRTLNGSATYHDSCSGLRELDIKKQPRNLLKTVKGLRLIEMTESEACCGFGGTFCVKYPDISEHIVNQKIKDIQSTHANILIGGDLGCLMNIAGRSSRLNLPLRCYHAAEVLAGMTDQPGIGERIKVSIATSNANQ